MLLKEARIQNYRNMKDVTVPFGQFSALVGPNNIGKTSILQALEYVFAPMNVRNVQIAKTDFMDPSKPIEIDVVFEDINNDDAAIFYHDEGLINPIDKTIHIRFISTWSSAEQDVYNECYFIRNDLPENQQRVTDFYTKYKQAVPYFLISSDRLASREIGLTKYSDLGRVLRIFSSDYLKPLATLRSEIQNATNKIENEKENWIDFPNDQYDTVVELIVKVFEIIPNDFPKQLNKASIFSLDNQLDEVNENWAELSAPLYEFITQNPETPYIKYTQTIIEKVPILIKRARVQLSLFELRTGILEERRFEEMNYGFQEIFREMLPDQDFNLSLFSIQDDELINQVSVDFDEKSILATGSGYQSMFVVGLKLVRTLAQLRFSEDIHVSNFVLGIEEPENHLHPHMQRHFINFINKIQKLWKKEGYQLQIIITTHSPSVVSRFEPFNLTILQKKDEMIKATQLKKEELESISKKHEQNITDLGKFQQQLQLCLEVLLEQYADVFFSNLVVVGEGFTEEGAIPIWASKLSNPIDFDRLGLCFLNAEGSRLRYYLRLLEAFGLDFVLLCDSGDNHDIQWVDSQLIFPTKQKAFEKEIMSSARITNLIKALIDAAPHISNENRMSNLKGQISAFSKIDSLEGLIEHLEKEPLPQQDYKKLCDEIFRALQKHKGLFLGRCIAKYTNEDEIPDNIQAMFKYARNQINTKTDRGYDVT